MMMLVMLLMTTAAAELVDVDVPVQYVDVLATPDQAPRPMTCTGYEVPSRLLVAESEVFARHLELG